MTLRPITARYAGACRCGGRVMRGDTITYNTTTRQVEGCFTCRTGEQKMTDSFSELWKKAVAAGTAAGATVQPKPMVVTQHANMLDDASPVEKAWIVADGLCGFAWVNVKPGTSSFAKWLVREGHARRDSYYGGVTVWISDYGQSVTRKTAYAEAMAKTLREAGIPRTFAQSRLD